MSSWLRGVKGEPGLQGPPGPPCVTCSCDHRPKPISARYISSGGKRSLTANDNLVVLDSDERITLFLPIMETVHEFCEDQYYSPCQLTIKTLSGNHCVKTSNGKINKHFTTLDLDHGAVKYEFTSTPDGWLMFIFKSQS